jgi:hypothetical protein
MRNALFRKRSLAVAGLAVTVTVTIAGQAAASAAATGVPAAGVPATRVPAAGGAAAHSVSASPGSATRGPGRWSQVTASGTPTTADVGLVRGADGVLHVIWAPGDIAGREKIMDTPIAAGGAPERPVTIASGQYTVTDPDATATPSGLDAFWNGIKANASGSPPTSRACCRRSDRPTARA